MEKEALAPLLKKPLKERDNDIAQLLAIGAYQLLFLRIPAHAAINSAVEACRPLDKKWAAGLINAVLRALQRDEKKLFEQLPAHAHAAHPLWLWKTINNAWPQQAETIFAANNSHPPLCLRVNQARTTTSDYLTQLQSGG